MILTIFLRLELSTLSLSNFNINRVLASSWASTRTVSGSNDVAGYDLELTYGTFHAAVALLALQGQRLVLLVVLVLGGQGLGVRHADHLKLKLGVENKTRFFWNIYTKRFRRTKGRFALDTDNT